MSEASGKFEFNSAVESVSSISPVPLTQQHMEEWWRRRKAGHLAAPAPGPSLLRWWQQQQQDPQQAAEAHQMLQMLQPQQGITAQQVMQVLQQQQQPQQQQQQPNQQQQQPNQQQQEDQQPAQQQQRRRRTPARNPAPEGRGAAGFWYNKHPALRDMFVEGTDSLFEAQLQSRSQQQQQQQQQQGEQATEAWQDRAQRQRLAKEVLQQLNPKDVLKQLKSKPAGQARSHARTSCCSTLTLLLGCIPYSHRRRCCSCGLSLPSLCSRSLTAWHMHCRVAICCASCTRSIS
jgi:hypothetical protein